MDVCRCSESYICSANAPQRRAPCTCSPQQVCAPCLAWERHYGQPRAPKPAQIHQQAVATLLRAYRLQHGLTRHQAAAHLGLGDGTVQDLENACTKFPSAHTIAVLRAVVKVPARYLRPARSEGGKGDDHE